MKYPPSPGTCTRSPRCGIPAASGGMNAAARQDHSKRAHTRLPSLRWVADHIAPVGCSGKVITKYPPSPGTCTRFPRCGIPAASGGANAAARQDHSKRAHARLPSLRSVADHIAPVGCSGKVVTKCPPSPGTCTRFPRCGPCGPGGCRPAAGRTPPPSAPRPPA